MTHRERVADFWDDVLRRWVERRDHVVPPLDRWLASQRESGGGPVDLDHYPEPYVGDLRGLRSEPRLVVVGTSPGPGYDELQGHHGIWTERIRKETYSRCLTRTPAQDLDSWRAVQDRPSRHWARLVAFAQRWLGDAEAGSRDLLGFEPYPWHARSARHPVGPPPSDLVDRFIWEPLREVDVPVVFGFGAPWLAWAPALGLPRVAFFGPGGDSFADDAGTASWQVAVHLLPSGQHLVVSAQHGSTGPPGRERVETMRATLEHVVDATTRGRSTITARGGQRFAASSLEELVEREGFGGYEQLARHLEGLVELPASWGSNRVRVFEERLPLFAIALPEDDDLGGIIAHEIRFPVTLRQLEQAFQAFVSEVLGEYDVPAPPAGPSPGLHLGDEAQGTERRIPVPDPDDASQAELVEFARTYNGYTRLLSDPQRLRAAALAPVEAAYARDDGEAVGIDLLRGALFCLAEADRTGSQGGFGSPREERLYRWIVRQIVRHSGGGVPWCGGAPAGIPGQRTQPSSGSDGGTTP